MLINLTDFFTAQGKSATIEVPYEAKAFDAEGTVYPLARESALKLTITNIDSGEVQIQGEMVVNIIMPCDRCLEDVEEVIELGFQYRIMEPDGFHEIDEEEQFFMDGYQLDTMKLINNELIMSLPMKILCKDDCKGLCPVCGKNLNKGECGCDTFIPDPRMAAIKDIFNANKEV